MASASGSTFFSKFFGVVVPPPAEKKDEPSSVQPETGATVSLPSTAVTDIGGESITGETQQQQEQQPQEYPAQPGYTTYAYQGYTYQAYASNYTQQHQQLAADGAADQQQQQQQPQAMSLEEYYYYHGNYAQQLAAAQYATSYETQQQTSQQAEHEKDEEQLQEPAEDKDVPHPIVESNIIASSEEREEQTRDVTSAESHVSESASAAGHIVAATAHDSTDLEESVAQNSVANSELPNVSIQINNSDVDVNTEGRALGADPSSVDMGQLREVVDGSNANLPVDSEESSDLPDQKEAEEKEGEAGPPCLRISIESDLQQSSFLSGDQVGEPKPSDQAPTPPSYEATERKEPSRLQGVSTKTKASLGLGDDLQHALKRAEQLSVEAGSEKKLGSKSKKRAIMATPSNTTAAVTSSSYNKSSGGAVKRTKARASKSAKPEKLTYVEQPTPMRRPRPSKSRSNNYMMLLSFVATFTIVMFQTSSSFSSSAAKARRVAASTGSEEAILVVEDTQGETDSTIQSNSSTEDSDVFTDRMVEDGVLGQRAGDDGRGTDPAQASIGELVVHDHVLAQVDVTGSGESMDVRVDSKPAHNDASVGALRKDTVADDVVEGGQPAASGGVELLRKEVSPLLDDLHRTEHGGKAIDLELAELAALSKDEGSQRKHHQRADLEDDEFMQMVRDSRAQLTPHKEGKEAMSRGSDLRVDPSLRTFASLESDLRVAVCVYGRARALDVTWEPLQRNILEPLQDYLHRVNGVVPTLSDKQEAAYKPQLFLAALRTSTSVTGLAVGDIPTEFAEGYERRLTSILRTLDPAGSRLMNSPEVGEAPPLLQPSGSNIYSPTDPDDPHESSTAWNQQTWLRVQVFKLMEAYELEQMKGRLFDLVLMLRMETIVMQPVPMPSRIPMDMLLVPTAPEDLGGLPDGVVMGSRAAVKAAFVAHRAMMASANLDQLHQQHVTFTKASFFESIPKLRGIGVHRIPLASCVSGRMDSHAIADDMSSASRYGEFCHSMSEARHAAQILGVPLRASLVHFEKGRGYFRHVRDASFGNLERFQGGFASGPAHVESESGSLQYAGIVESVEQCEQLCCEDKECHTATYFPAADYSKDGEYGNILGWVKAWWKHCYLRRGDFSQGNTHLYSSVVTRAEEQLIAADISEKVVTVASYSRDQNGTKWSCLVH